MRIRIAAFGERKITLETDSFADVHSYAMAYNIGKFLRKRKIRQQTYENIYTDILDLAVFSEEIRLNQSTDMHVRI